MKKEWFEPGLDGKSEFERLSATVGFGAAGTAAAFRMLLSEETSNDVTSLRTEIYQLRQSLERTKLAVNTTREQRDRFWSQRDAARAEVERLTDERDALQARIDGGVRVCRFPSMKKSWSENIASFPESCERGILLIDEQPLDHIADAGKMVDERTTPGTRADRRAS